ncbi:hypothetical protein ACVGXN_05215, partial [Enterobacter hormaechei]
LKTDNGWQLIGVQSSGAAGQHPWRALKPALCGTRFIVPRESHAPVSYKQIPPHHTKTKK